MRCISFSRARDGTRTRGPDLGKVVLHQLSHSRISCCVGYVCRTHLISYSVDEHLSTPFFIFFEKLEQFIILRRFHDPNCHVARGGSYNVIISMRRLKMSAKTKIVVLHMKELIYTLIFAGLGILLIFLLLFMFLPGKEDGESVETMRYVAGVYTSSIQFGEHAVDMQVIVDENRIQSVSMVNLDETVETMYPLMEPALENIADQVVEKQTTEGITYSADYQYTSVVLLNAIENALAKAELSGAEMGE